MDLLVMAAVFMQFLVVLAIVMYIITALSINKVLKAVSYENTWAGWVPLYNVYVMHEVMNQKGGKVTLPLFNKEIDNQFFNFIWLAPMAVSWVPLIGSVATMAASIYLAYVYARFYIPRIKGTTDEESNGLIIVATLIPIVTFIVMLTLKEWTARPGDLYPKSNKENAMQKGEPSLVENDETIDF